MVVTVIVVYLRAGVRTFVPQDIVSEHVLSIS